MSIGGVIGLVVCAFLLGVTLAGVVFKPEEITAFTWQKEKWTVLGLVAFMVAVICFEINK